MGKWFILGVLCCMLALGAFLFRSWQKHEKLAHFLADNSGTISVDASPTVYLACEGVPAKMTPDALDRLGPLLVGNRIQKISFTGTTLASRDVESFLRTNRDVFEAIFLHGSRVEPSIVDVLLDCKKLAIVSVELDVLNDENLRRLREHPTLRVFHVYADQVDESREDFVSARLSPSTVSFHHTK